MIQEEIKCLDEAADKYLDTVPESPIMEGDYVALDVLQAFKAGAEWMKSQLWHTDKPTDKLIVAECRNGFGEFGGKFSLLALSKGVPYEYYHDACGEEVPYTAIVRWIKIK